MTVGARGLASRLALATLVAAAGIALLQTFVAASERERQAPVVRPSAPASPLAALPFPVGAVTGVVRLARRADAFAPDVAPVLLLAADGSLSLHRGPRAPAAADVGLVLPGGPLAHWSPASRTALVELLGAWVVERPLPLARVQVVDGVLAAAELRFVASWVP